MGAKSWPFKVSALQSDWSGPPVEDLAKRELLALRYPDFREFANFTTVWEDPAKDLEKFSHIQKRQYGSAYDHSQKSKLDSAQGGSGVSL